jgi:ubiquinone/menaquinone biosynthesis C-methylase UbiE
LNGKPIPNYIYGDAKKLPFGKGTVDYIWIENPADGGEWAAEALRVIKPGGRIKIYGTKKGIKAYLAAFTKINPKIVVNDAGDYLETGLGNGYTLEIPK